MRERTEPVWLRRLRIESPNLREFLGEMLGTFILAFFSIAAGAQRVLSGTSATDDVTVPLANGFGVAMAIYSCGAVSGGMVNPAISLAMMLSGKWNWRRFPFHVAGQMLGAFLASCVVYGVYNEAFDHFDGGHRQVFGANGTAAIFSSFPRPFLSIQNGFFDSMLSTGLLILCTHALTDKHNWGPSQGFVPVAVGLCVFVILCTLGSNCGGVINPARDLGPRVFLVIAGWGRSVFSHRDYSWFWVPLVAPMVGSALFTLIYWTFVAHHWPDKDNQHEMDRKRAEANGRENNNGHLNPAFENDPDNISTKF